EIRPDLENDEIADWRRRGHRDADARRGARFHTGRWVLPHPRDMAPFIPLWNECRRHFGLAGHPYRLRIRTRGTSKALHATPPWQVQHDWTTQSDRLAVLRQLLLRNSDEVRVNFDDATQHRRTLVLKWEGAALELTLDQGVGPWQPADRYRFDFAKTPDEQAQD